MTRNVLILDGHPDPADDRLIHALSAAYREGAQASNHTVQVIRLADLTFPVLRSQADYDSWDKPTIGAVLKKIGVTMAGKVGGVSGPIWGTAFLRAGVSAGDKTELVPDDIIALLRAAIGGIKQRGESDLGDKTLLDALVPAVDSLEASFADPSTAADHGVAALQHAADVAVKAAEDTAPMIAKRGRAAYTGERSIGSVDAGATAVGVIFQAISAAWRDKYGK